MAARGDIGLLQDTPQTDAWTAWGIAYRDVVILGPDGRRVGVYNLTTHNLSDPNDYAELRALLRSAAGL